MTPSPPAQVPSPPAVGLSPAQHVLRHGLRPGEQPHRRGPRGARKTGEGRGGHRTRVQDLPRAHHRPRGRRHRPASPATTTPAGRRSTPTAPGRSSPPRTASGTCTTRTRTSASGCCRASAGDAEPHWHPTNPNLLYRAADARHRHDLSTNSNVANEHHAGGRRLGRPPGGPLAHVASRPGRVPRVHRSKRPDATGASSPWASNATSSACSPGTATPTPSPACATWARAARPREHVAERRPLRGVERRPDGGHRIHARLHQQPPAAEEFQPLGHRPRRATATTCTSPSTTARTTATSS